MKQLLVEKYRPTTTKTYVFQDSLTEKKVSKWIKEGEIPNLLFTGPPGCGKSTLARVLLEEFKMEPTDVKRVNASTQNGIGFIRDELEPWMRKTNFGPFKIVLLEEADRISAAGQKALRDIMESYSDSVRFILTANYPKSIIDAIHSRCQTIEMGSINMDGITDLVCDIVEAEGIEVLDENDLLSHIEMYAPDLRKIINSIDENTDEAKLLHRASYSSMAADADGWLQVWADTEKELTLDGLLELTEAVDMNNYEFYYEAMYNHSSRLQNQADAVVLISQYLDKAQRSANQRLHLDACLYHIFMEME